MNETRCDQCQAPLIENTNLISQDGAKVCSACYFEEVDDLERSMLLDNYEASVIEEKIWRAKGSPAHPTWTYELLPHQLSLWGGDMLSSMQYQM